MRKLILFALLPCVVQAQEAVRITPQRPIEELRREALAAQPPQESAKRKPELVELTSLDVTIKLDIRYATANNFLSTAVYEQSRAFLQEPAAKALVKAHSWLKKRGYGLLIHDAYRPWYVTKIFWEATPPDKREFVADPASGSRHNRGAAVDLTLYDLKTGQAVEMPSLYDEFSPRAYPNYAGGTEEQRRLRDLLREAMERHRFKVIENEWWHFDYKDWKKYPILNISFAEAGAEPLKPGTLLYDAPNFTSACAAFPKPERTRDPEPPNRAVRAEDVEIVNSESTSASTDVFRRSRWSAAPAAISTAKLAMWRWTGTGRRSATFEIPCMWNSISHFIDRPTLTGSARSSP